MSNTGPSRREVLALVGAYLLRPNIATTAPLEPFISGWAPSSLGLAVSPDGRTAYVAFSMDDGVIEVDLASGAMGAYNVSSAGPMLASGQVLLTPDAHNLYVANNGTQNILSIDAAGKRVRGVLAIPPSSFGCMTCLPDGSKVYVAGVDLYEITVADNSFRRMPAGGICFRAVAASQREPGVIYAYGERCGSKQEQGLIRYRVTDGAVLLDRSLPYEVWHAGGQARLILSAQEDIGYIGTCTVSNDRGYGKLYVVDLKTLEVTASCDIDYGVTDFVLREDTRRIYTIGFWSGASPNRLPVTEWDIPSRAVTRQMFFDNCSDLRAIALNPTDPRIAYYTEGDRSEMRAVDLTSGEQVASWRFTPPNNIVPYTFATDGWRTFVGGGQAPGRLFRIDMRTGATREIKGPSGPNNRGFFSGGLLHYLKPDRITTYDPDRETVVREVSYGRNFNPKCGTPVGDAVAFLDFDSAAGVVNLVVVDAASGKPRKIIPMPTMSVGHRVILSPEGNKAYVTFGGMQGPAHIRIYDPLTWESRTEIVLAPRTWEHGSTGFCDGVFDVVNRVAYITGFMRVFRLDMDSDQLLDMLRPADVYDQINRQSGWSATALSGIRFCAGNRLLVASGDSHQVFTYDLSAKRWLLNLINARGYFQSDSTCSPDGRFFFTVNSRSDSVSMFDALRGRLLRVIDLQAPAQNRLLSANVVNAASLLPGPVAPGELITIFGAGLGPEEGLAAGSDLAGVRVLFDGAEAPLLYVQSNQIYARVPDGVSAGSSARLTIDYQGQVTEELELETAESAPGLFTEDGTGAGPALAQDSAGKLVSAANPTVRGSLVTLFITGAGRAGAPPALTATVGGLAANVESTTAMTGDLAGVLLCGVRIPMGAAPGPALPVLLRAGAAASQPNVTLAVA